MENALHGILTRRLLLQKVPQVVCVCGAGFVHAQMVCERAVEYSGVVAQEVASINNYFKHVVKVCVLR
jgi:hypothetical protein